MKANPIFQMQSKEFWANIRLISQQVGYTERGKGTIKIPSLAEVTNCFNELNLKTNHLFDGNELSEFGKNLFDYFQYRSNVLNDEVKNYLMNKEEAEHLFNELRNKLKPSENCPLPMNKQKGEKKNYAFLTCIVNMLIESSVGNNFDADPRSLTIFIEGDMPFRTLARRVDGAYPSTINPSAIWEIKEYYYTTTFGSRVADGVYETLLDGMELEELRANSSNKTKHLLIVDDFFTWWDCGKSYLCRMIDMIHMNYVDEVIFGKEVISRIPQIFEELNSN